ncbi:MAG: hypothetical protein HY744_10330 [Deltaproteobacteria bacterium]|nr:hypothetical protein [Deltaproteobacteria bacterium]
MTPMCFPLVRGASALALGVFLSVLAAFGCGGRRDGPPSYSGVTDVGSGSGSSSGGGAGGEGGGSSSSSGAVPEHVWSFSFGDDKEQFGQALCADQSGNVFVTGGFDGTLNLGGTPLQSAGGGDVFLAKFDTSGAHVWSKGFGDAKTQEVYGIACDGAGAVIITGRMVGSVDFGGGLKSGLGSWSLFLAKLDATGAHVWSGVYGDGQNQRGTGLAIDSSNNILVTGEVKKTIDFGKGAIKGPGWFLAKLDPQGAELWAKSFGTPQVVCEASGVAVDGTDSAIITGRFDNVIDFGLGPIQGKGTETGDIYLAKFDPDGKPMWSEGYGDADNQNVLAIAAGADDAVAITGGFVGTVDFGGGKLEAAGKGAFDVFVAAFDLNAEHVFSMRSGSVAAQVGKAIDIDANGDAIVGGTFGGTVSFGGKLLETQGNGAAFVAKLGGDGTHKWSDGFGDTGKTNGAVVRGVATDATGSVFATGSFDGKIDFGGSELVAAGASGASDVFLVKFKP